MSRFYALELERLLDVTQYGYSVCIEGPLEVLLRPHSGVNQTGFTHPMGTPIYRNPDKLRNPNMLKVARAAVPTYNAKHLNCEH